MDVFWNTIAAYNAATWPVQLLLVAVAAVLTLLLYLRPTRAVRVAMKVFMAALNFWIAGVYYFIYTPGLLWCCSVCRSFIRSSRWPWGVLFR